MRHKPDFVAKFRPYPLIFNSLNVGLELTTGYRSSLAIDINKSANLFRNLRALGRLDGLFIAYRYYPFAKESASAGWYIGPRVSYAHLQYAGIFQLFTRFDTGGEVKLFSVGATTGYQLVTRSNIVLDVQGNLGILHHAKYHRPGSHSPLTREDVTGFGIFPNLLIGVGYRFSHRSCCCPPPS